MTDWQTLYGSRMKPVASPADGTSSSQSVFQTGPATFPPSPWVDKRFGGEMLYQTFDISENKLVMRVRNIDGEVRDELVIAK